MREYKVIVGTAATGNARGGKQQHEKFEAEVNEAIGDGWELFGGVGSGTGAVATLCSIAQAMTREKESDLTTPSKQL